MASKLVFRDPETGRETPLPSDVPNAEIIQLPDLPAVPDDPAARDALHRSRHFREIEIMSNDETLPVGLRFRMKQWLHEIEHGKAVVQTRDLTDSKQPTSAASMDEVMRRLQRPRRIIDVTPDVEGAE